MLTRNLRHHQSLRNQIRRFVSRTVSEHDAGLGVGEIRTGLDAVHRVEFETPSFLAEPRTCAVIGAPFSYGQPYHGPDDAPASLREAGLHEALGKLQWRVLEVGDLKFKSPSRNDPVYTGPGRAKLSYAVGKACEAIHEKVYTQANKGNFVLTLGGDHSIALGTVAGILRARPNVGVLWADAHADINTPEISGSGNVHGMPLAFLMRLVKGKVPGMEFLENVPALDPKQLVYVGLRDIDFGERQIIKNLGIKAFTMFHIDKYGIGKVMEMAMDALDNRPLHLSYDIDACDPIIAPSTGTAVRGGLTFREAHFIAEAAAETHRLGSFDLVEVNPTLKGEEAWAQSLGQQTVELGLALTASALGNRML